MRTKLRIRGLGILLLAVLAGLPGGTVSSWLRLDQPALAAPLPGIEAQGSWLGDEEAVLDWAEVPDVFPGVKHLQVSVDTPRRMDLHCVRIDTETPGLQFYTTPRADPWVQDSTETRRQTTRDFLREARRAGMPMVVAINADAFSPWPAPWDEETPTNLLGLAVSDGVLVSPGSGTASLLIDQEGHARMALTDASTDIQSIRTAVSGFGFCLLEGLPLVGDGATHPRTGIGLSADQRFVYLMTIDGRRHASQGATTEEVGRWLQRFGAYTGINMDGGGSTTLTLWNPSAPEADQVELLNHPVGNGLNWLTLPLESEAASYTPTERCTGNSLGVCVPSPDPAVGAAPGPGASEGVTPDCPPDQ